MMKYDMEDQAFVESLAASETGTRLARLLRNIETHYADIRNLEGVDARVRIDSLGILREALLDKILVLSGKADLPDNDEFR